uniref:Uncharacterized protein n=1 Tax=Lepeophtheirus salmonis TaxID=72036 RepID=A0A0K2UAM8_LEPSM
MNYLHCIIFIFVGLTSPVTPFKYLYGPDSEGKASIVDLNPGKPVSSCSLNLPNLPIPDLSCTSTTFIEGKLTVCGGSRSGFTSSHCFQLENNAWVKFPSLPEPRTCATSIWINNGTQWWLTGGSGPSSRSVSSGVVYDVAKGAWETGPRIPILSHGHCLVPLKDDRVMLLGGWKKIPIIKPIYNKDVYIFENGEWVLQEGGLETQFKRFGFSQTCARLKNGGVMILGGKPKGENHVEVWNSEFGFWSVEDEAMGLPLEHIWYPSSALDEEGNVYIIGGETPNNGNYNEVSDKVLKWDGKSWSIQEGALPFPMTFSSISQLSDDTELSC